jgi:hypothetical protein
MTLVTTSARDEADAAALHPKRAGHSYERPQFTYTELLPSTCRPPCRPVPRLLLLRLFLQIGQRGVRQRFVFGG